MISGPRHSQWINRICRVYLVLLHAYPKAFRIQFGGEMQQVFRDRCRAAATGKDLLLLIVLLFRDWLTTSVRERLAALRQTGIASPAAHAIQILIKSWWLLALCGFLDAIFAGVDLFDRGADGSFSLRTSVNSTETLENMGLLALAAGACTILAGIWGSRKDKSWLVVINGLACGTLGLKLRGFFGFSIGFRSLALLIVVMGLSLGIYQLSTARTLRRNSPGKFLLAVAGAVSVGFALAFFAFAFNWVQLSPRPLSDFLWFGSYFGFTALSMLGLAVGLHGASPFRAALPQARA